MDYVTSTYVSRVGRLGNSLLQIASAIAYGLDNNKQPVFTKWDYQQYVFLNLIAEETQPKWNRVAHNNGSYQPLEIKEGNVDLQDHFLSEKFFSHRRDEILKIIKLEPKHNYWLYKKYKYTFEGNTCSIHVRRGDYLQEEQKKYHGVLTLNYYTEAIKKLYGEKYDHVKFVICSDDIAWCKENFHLPNTCFIEGEKDIIDLFLMSKCKDNIIANSTFSWWSAWLNQRPGNRVIAPINWFYNTPGWNDLYRENWIKI